MFGSRRRPSLIEPAHLSTLIAEGVHVTGDLGFCGGMRIDGRIEGDIVGRAGEGDGKGKGKGTPSLLVLSAKGRIEGRVDCADAVINGEVVGDLDIRHRLELQSDARIRGTIRYRQLQMDVGASVTGELIRVDDGAGGNVVELAVDKSGAANDRR